MRLNTVKYKNFVEGEQEQRSETLLGKQQKQRFRTRFLSALKINHVADVETEIVNFTESLLHFDSLQLDYFRTVSLLEFYSSLT